MQDFQPSAVFNGSSLGFNDCSSDVLLSLCYCFLLDSDDHIKLFSVFLHVANSPSCCVTVLFKVVSKDR